MTNRMKPLCVRCGDTYSAKRANAGYQLCLFCGEKDAQTRRHTIAPMHKSNYMLITNMEDLKGLNNKGGMFR
jgi:tRNA(Ile2) C34 agmatinyltransferase TiaS